MGLEREACITVSRGITGLDSSRHDAGTRPTGGKKEDTKGRANN